MNQQEKLWYWLAFFVIGVAIYEFGAKNVTHLETVYQDYGSISHTFYTVVFTGGLCLSTYSILTIYVAVKQSLNSCYGSKAT